MEFVKDPENVDDALDEVVKYLDNQLLANCPKMVTIGITVIGQPVLMYIKVAPVMLSQTGMMSAIVEWPLPLANSPTGKKVR